MYFKRAREVSIEVSINEIFLWFKSLKKMLNVEILYMLLIDKNNMHKDIKKKKKTTSSLVIKTLLQKVWFCSRKKYYRSKVILQYIP